MSGSEKKSRDQDQSPGQNSKTAATETEKGKNDMITALKYHRIRFEEMLRADTEIPISVKVSIMEHFLASLRYAMTRRTEELRQELAGREKLAP